MESNRRDGPMDTIILLGVYKMKLLLLCKYTLKLEAPDMNLNLKLIFCLQL